jgi:predicted nucleotidyltransferase/predicted transcriptional regulator
MEWRRPLATVTPTLDGDVLAVLAQHNAAFTTGQLRRILIQPSSEGIRKVLQRLTRQGIVESERVGNAFTYRLNHEHLAAEYVIGLARMPQTLLSRLEDRLGSWEIPPVYAAVFGSAARGAMTTDSDLDVLLVRPDSASSALWDTQVHDLAAQVTRWVGNDVRPLQFTAREVTERGDLEQVLQDVLREGLTVAGSREWLSRHVRTPRR